MKNLMELTDEELFAYWDEATKQAEVKDEWSEVIRIENELERRGIHPNP